MKSCRVPHTAITVSRIAYGCSRLAAWDDRPIDAEATAKAEILIKTACERGVTLFDHADLYAFGKSEAVFGELLKRSPGLRQKIVIQSKCGQFFPAGWQVGKPIGVDLSKSHIVKAAEGSLQRLATDYLDILLLHAPDPLMSEEIAEAFNRLQRDGKVRYFGVSNFNAAQIERLGKCIEQRLVVNQVHVGLGAMDLIADGMEFTLGLARGAPPETPPVARVGTGTLDYCQLNNIQVQAWSPLASDLLKSPTEVSPELRPTALLLAELAARKKVTPAAIVLAWLMHHGAQIVPVIGSTDRKHLVEDCAADQVSLTREEWYALFAAATSSC